MDAADAGRGHDDRLGTFRLKKLANSGLIRKVKLIVCPQDEIGVAALL